MVSLTTTDEVFILDLGADANILNLDSMGQLAAALATVSASHGAAALLTIASGNVWTTGFDREWITTRASDDPEVRETIKCLEEVVASLLCLPVISVAAIQGHCFAAGAIFAMAHDIRMMREDRGYFCLPEVNLSVPFTSGISKMLEKKMPASTAFEAMVTGRRYNAAEALRAGIIERALPASELRESAFARALSLSSLAGSSIQTIRMQLCRPALDLL